MYTNTKEFLGLNLVGEMTKEISRIWQQICYFLDRI